MFVQRKFMVCKHQHFYNLADLNSTSGECKEHILKNINVENVFETIILADLYSDQILKDEAMVFFTGNVKRCMKSAAYKELAPKHQPLVIEILNNIIAEKLN